MSKVTMREVYRTLLDAKKWDWAEVRDLARVNPSMTYDQFAGIIRTSELLVDRVTIRQKWEIGIAQGVFVLESKHKVRVNLSLIELKTDTHIPAARVDMSVCVNESRGADARERARAREEGQE